MSENDWDFVTVMASRTGLKAAREAADEIVTTLAAVDRYLRDMTEHMELRGNGDDPSLPVGLVLRGLRSVAEGEAARVFDLLACLSEDAEKAAARRDRPAGEADHADA